MNFGIRKEEALFLFHLIIFERADYGEEKLKKIYGNIDIDGMLQQLQIIIQLGSSVEEEKEIERIFGDKND